MYEKEYLSTKGWPVLQECEFIFLGELSEINIFERIGIHRYLAQNEELSDRIVCGSVLEHSKAIFDEVQRRVQDG